MKDGRATGVVLADGTELKARKVVSSVDANVTFLKLMDAKELPAEFADSIRHIDYASASCKINVALSELPDFTCLPRQHAGPAAPRHDPPLPDPGLHRAGLRRPSTGTLAQSDPRGTIPSAVDDTVAPPGKHLMSMFIQYAPYKLAGDAGTLEENKKRFADRCFDIMTDYAPNFRRSVLNRQVLSPLDLETRFGLTGGNIFQGAMSLSSLSFMRPVPGYADYRTPVKGLYLCGAATHPGRRRDGRLRIQRRAGDSEGSVGVESRES